MASDGTAFDPSLEGKRVLVTGAGQGVGAAIARRLAAAGCRVGVNDVIASRATSVVDEIVAAGGDAETAVFDVTDDGAVLESVGAARADILVNNAGNGGPDSFGRIAPFVDTTPDDWRPLLAVNLDGVLSCTRAALPHMIEAGWGRVITISSDAGRTGGARYAAYSAAKAGAAGFSRAVAREVARHGITVNTVSLGTMRTPMTEPLWSESDSEELRRNVLSSYLVRRPGNPDDAAWMVLMLASPHASWITGQTIAVNGGSSMTL